MPNKPRENASYPLIQQSTKTLEEPRRQIAVTLLPKKVLCGDTNGEPNHWGVIVSSDEEAETGNTVQYVLYFACTHVCVYYGLLLG